MASHKFLRTRHAYSLILAVLALSAYFGWASRPVAKAENLPKKQKTQELAEASLKYSVEQLDNTKGLSNSSVNCIFQDSQNLLWIGTWDGLSRYDGASFKVFRPEPGSKSSLSNQVILKVAEDKQGKIWVLTMHGINRYDKKTGKFEQFYFSKDRQPQSESEFNIAVDAKGNVYCAVKDWGIGYFDSKEFRLLPIQGLPNGIVRKMGIYNDNLLLLYSDNRLFSVNTHPKFQPKLLHSKIRSFDVNAKGEIAAASVSGELIYFSADSRIPKIIPNQNASAIVGHLPEGFLICGKNGYSVSDFSSEKTAAPWMRYLKNQKITSVLLGTENVLWMGTDGDGVLKAYPQKKSFSLVTASQIPELQGGIVRAFLDDGNSFWVGTKGKGLFRIQNGIEPNTTIPFSYQNFTDANSRIDNSVYALSKGKDNLVFIGSDGDGLAVYDLRTSKLLGWKDISGSDKCDYFKSVYAIYEDDGGNIWLGTNGYGLICLKVERSANGLKVHQPKHYQAQKSNGSLGSNIVFSIVPKNQNELWIGTRLGGLNLFDKRTGKFTAYRNDASNPRSLSNNDVLCLAKDASGRLWIGTSYGLNLLEASEGEKPEFRSFTVKDGLPDNTIHGIVSGKDSNLWISTNFGLSNFVPYPQKFINYSRNDGLQNNEFADGAFYLDPKNGLVFMGGIKGFNYFHPSQIRESQAIPDLLIDKIAGQNQAEPYFQGLVVSPDSENHPSIVLKHDENFFDIQIGALTYINNDKCHYAYKLEGFDKEWKSIGNRKIISFTNVPRGSYSLWMKWSNSDGVWTDAVRAADIRVKPVFWQSNAALAFYAALAIVFGWFVRSYQLKRQSLKQNILLREKEEEIHENRLTFFTNIAHEFLTPLTLIVGPVQKLSETPELDQRNRKFVNMIQRNSSRLLFLTQQLLEFRKAEYDYLEVTVRRFDFVNLMEQVAELFDEWAFEKNIDYKLEMPQELAGWFDKDKSEKIVFNLMSNAFKYTPANGRISIRVGFEDDPRKRLMIAVSNTGKGIPKEKMESLFDRFFLADIKSQDSEMFRTGIGLAYIKKLVTVLRGEILVSSVPDEETVFTILLPCDKSAFEEKEIDLESAPILISHHLKNILEEISEKPEKTPEKIAVLEQIENNKQTILVVEDESEIHSFLRDLLSSRYNIISAYNGLEALEIVENTTPDLIISDVMMPLMDGVEFCRKIKADHRTCHIPFIMLTAKESVVHRIEGLESGANSYIPKPFYPEHLLVRITKLLEEKELILKHFTYENDFEPVHGKTAASSEKQFVRAIISIIRSNIDSENLQGTFLEKELGLSTSQLYRKTKEMFGLSPGDLIRSMRLKYAAELLRQNVLTVSEVCYKTGFNNRSYFYREFNKVYKMTPKNYQLRYKARIESFSNN